MNDQELAELVIALGVGRTSEPYVDVIDGFFSIAENVDEDGWCGGDDPWQGPKDFVRDWRVAGALMEILIPSDAPFTVSVTMDSDEKFGAWFRGEGIAHQDSMCRSVVEMCVVALEGLKA